MALSYPTIIPGLRSPFDQVNGLVYFGRMLDKIRLAAAGKLPEGWQPMRGTTVKELLTGAAARSYTSIWMKADFRLARGD